MMESTISQPLNAADLLKLGYEDDPMLMEDMSLCTLCSHTCFAIGTVGS